MYVLLPAEACQSNYSALKGAGQVVQLASSILWDSGLDEQYNNTVHFQQQRRKVGSELLEALSHNMRPNLGFRKAYCPANTHTTLLQLLF